MKKAKQKLKLKKQTGVVKYRDRFALAEEALQKRLTRLVHAWAKFQKAKAAVYRAERRFNIKVASNPTGLGRRKLGV